MVAALKPFSERSNIWFVLELALLTPVVIFLCLVWWATVTGILDIASIMLEDSKSYFNLILADHHPGLSLWCELVYFCGLSLQW